MKRILTIVTFALLISSLVLGQTKDKSDKKQSGSVEQAIMQIEQETVAALLKGDSSVFERVLADTYILTGPDGVVSDKAGLIAMIKSGDLKYESLQNADMKVQVYGDTAVVTFRSMEKGSMKGQDFSGPHRWTEVFVKQGGRWQMVSTHGVRIAQQCGNK